MQRKATRSSRSPTSTRQHKVMTIVGPAGSSPIRTVSALRSASSIYIRQPGSSKGWPVRKWSLRSAGGRVGSGLSAERTREVVCRRPPSSAMVAVLSVGVVYRSGSGRAHFPSPASGAASHQQRPAGHADHALEHPPPRDHRSDPRRRGSGEWTSAPSQLSSPFGSLCFRA
jgi:hypothetical protein